MVHSGFAATVVALLCALPMARAGFYPKNSPVIQLDGKDYAKLIEKSNHTTVCGKSFGVWRIVPRRLLALLTSTIGLQILEFYAPWCGHCQNLKPAYEKAAKNLAGLAKVAAINCDEDSNKPFCGSMGVQGFPTLKIVRPGMKAGSKPVVEDYQGARTATAIVDAVVAKINNHVKKVTDKDIDSFLKKDNETAKAILFTEKGKTSALLRSVAIDFLGVITVGQVRDKEEATVDMFGIDEYPTLVLLPGGDKESVVYDGEMKKDAIVSFLSQAGAPNPDSSSAKADKKPKASSKPKEKASAKPSAAKKEKSSSSSTASAETEEATASSETKADDTKTAPVIVDSALPLPALNTPEKLVKECLSPKSGTSVLVFAPASPEEGSAAAKALDSIAQVAHRLRKANPKMFPFFSVPSDNAAHADTLKALGLEGGGVEVVAVNARRGWWRRYDPAGAFEKTTIEGWVDAVRMSEGKKNKLPQGLVAEETPVQPASPDPSPETPEPEASPARDEL